MGPPTFKNESVMNISLRFLLLQVLNYLQHTCIILAVMYVLSAMQLLLLLLLQKPGKERPGKPCVPLKKSDSVRMLQAEFSIIRIFPWNF